MSKKKRKKNKKKGVTQKQKIDLLNSILLLVTNTIRLIVTLIDLFI